MIKQLKYNSIGGRYEEVLSYLASKTKTPTVVDVGASLNPWGGNFITATVDINQSSNPARMKFTGDINHMDVWEEVLNYVRINGKFDFCICTHTLEDISNPIFVSKMLSKIAYEGFVAVPSKYVECARTGSVGLCRGWLHHRWIFNDEEDGIIAYPKLPFTEHLQCLDEVAQSFSEGVAELSFFWETSCDIQAINNDFFPSDAFAIEAYNRLLR